MSTNLGTINDNFSVIRFFGGKDKGVCVQLTPKSDDRYIKMTASEIIALLPMLKCVIDYELDRKKTECEELIKAHKELEKSLFSDVKAVCEMAISQRLLDFATLLTFDKVEITDAEEDLL